jgi:hypothetical protein
MLGNKGQAGHKYYDQSSRVVVRDRGTAVALVAGSGLAGRLRGAQDTKSPTSAVPQPVGMD